MTNLGEGLYQSDEQSFAPCSLFFADHHVSLTNGAADWKSPSADRTE
jgi:hypothetical protein